MDGRLGTVQHCCYGILPASIDGVTLYDVAALGLAVGGNVLYVLGSTFLSAYSLDHTTGALTLKKTTEIDGSAVFPSLQLVQNKLYVSETVAGIYNVRRYSIKGTLEKAISIGAVPDPAPTEVNVFVG